jgi:signal transduction histidine kinase
MRFQFQRFIAMAMLAWTFITAPANSLAQLNVNPPPPKVGVLVDNYPFSFRDTDGRIKGFAYELLQEIEHVMNLKFARIEGTTVEINGAFRERRVDLLQSYARSPERAATAEFSVPYLPMYGQVFVRQGGLIANTLDDLKNRRVLVHRGSLGERLLLEAGLSNAIVHVDSVEQALVMVNRGEGDATLATRLTGLSLAHRLGLKDLRALEMKIDNFNVDYCFAVQKGNHGLLNSLNEGMAIMVRTGKFDELYQKWFGFVTPTGYSPEQILLTVAIGLSLALGIALWAVLRQRALRQQISRQAESLRAQKSQLETTVAEQERAEAELRVFSRQLQALSARLETSREEERVRISREIHDELGQKLTGLKMDLHWVETRLEQIPDDKLRAGLEDKIVAASAAADETMVTVQRIAAELRPAMLDNLGLVPALRFETSQFETRANIPVKLDLPAEPLDLPSAIATTVYRIYQEVLTNVARHSQATQVDVNLGINAENLLLQVQDNGVGVSSEDLLNPNSLGLLGMKERAAMVNGRVRVSGIPGNGTLVRLEISIENATPQTNNADGPASLLR